MSEKSPEVASGLNALGSFNSSGSSANQQKDEGPLLDDLFRSIKSSAFQPVPAGPEPSDSSTLQRKFQGSSRSHPASMSNKYNSYLYRAGNFASKVKN